MSLSFFISLNHKHKGPTHLGARDHGSFPLLPTPKQLKGAQKQSQPKSVFPNLPLSGIDHHYPNSERVREEEEEEEDLLLR